MTLSHVTEQFLKLALDIFRGGIFERHSHLLKKDDAPAFPETMNLALECSDRDSQFDGNLIIPFFRLRAEPEEWLQCGEDLESANSSSSNFIDFSSEESAQRR